MNGFALGPLLLSLDRLAVVLGFIVLLVFAEVLTRRVDLRFGRWSYLAAAAGVVSARLGHVLENLDTSAATPWRVLAIWQAGFSLPWAVLPVLVVTAAALPRPRLAAWGLAAVAAGVLAWGAVDRLTTDANAPRLPQVTLQAIEGPPVTLADTAERPTVINTWATWCPPCRREMPLLADAARAHPEVRFIFANQGEDPGEIRTYFRREKLQLPNVVLDPATAIPRHYGAVGVPMTLFVRPNGSLAGHHTGEISPEQLKAKLSAAKR
ncbi:TlpA disulfide reductase family protein [Phenylobacterium sp.]|uniref:TlpA disulfide reductase family protein n=1 Tax=Phenylobacterium sp. TaxID=1871053 RepID=UPI00260F6BDD|nr:TlpA disulfide reductase family protein [Phenylobacterium sp.]